MAYAVEASAFAAFAPVDVEAGSAEEAALVAVARDGHRVQESAGGRLRTKGAGESMSQPWNRGEGAKKKQNSRYIYNIAA